jgi:hypothetical protein
MKVQKLFRWNHKRMTRLDNTDLLFKFASRNNDNHDNIDSAQDTSSPH